jgi:pimeloyl-ACP methyl ester carboxylesterase
MGRVRAREPDVEGWVERGGVRVGYEVHGTGDTTIVLLASWAIVHARQWKFQVPYLARSFRVLVVEGRGNGRADRPATDEAYTDVEYVEDAVAAMDAIGAGRAVVCGLSAGARHAVQLAARHPERVAAVIAIGTALPQPAPGFDEPQPVYQGWEKYNRHYWNADYPGWVAFFAAQMFTEPHSLKHREDVLGWGLETDARTLARTVRAREATDPAEIEAVCRALRCPVLVVHGDGDRIAPHATATDLARWTGGDLVTLEGGGHAPPLRDPVRTNVLIRDFVEHLAGRPRPPAVWTRPPQRRRRVLFVCSPIGLGHARRDLVIADELRVRHPDLEIDWLTQHPVIRLLEARGERVHPASRLLAGESAHFESEAGEHDLHAFQAVRRMDEIMLANFMVFHDLVDADPYDLWIVDEGWDVDHFLFENPELKRAPYVWLSDFVGWLPMPDGGEAEAALTADWNAERVERIRRWPRLRDRSIFVGNPGDAVDAPLGPGLPTVREFACERYTFSGYVSGTPPVPDRDALRAELGYHPDERVCLVTVGGTGVGGPLLRRAAAAFPGAARTVPGLRMVIVAGPRIDPASVPVPAGVEVRGYVPDLHRHLAACDVAVVQGGLTTTMELVEARRPFVYVPLGHHFEQQIHVPHRLAQYRAGRRLDYADTDPDRLAAAVAAEIDHPVDYRPVESDGAARAAALLGELL